MVRISAGSKKGVKLKENRRSPLLRPLTDKIKNALFSILFDRIKNADILDLFAGTGVFGFEALSREAASVTFVDKGYNNIRLIRDNAEKLGFGEKVDLVNRDFKKALEFLEKTVRRFSIIFIDPPYNTDFAEQAINHPSFASLITSGGLVIIRVHHKTRLPVSAGNLRVIDERKYGEAKVYFYMPAASDEI